MKIRKRIILSLSLFVGIVMVCFILITTLSGYRYEYKKFKKFLLTIAVVMLFRYLILEHIEFVIHAAICALRDRNGNSEKSFIQRQDKDESDDQNYKPMEYLKLSLKSLKSQLNLEQCHRNESLNVEYKKLTQDFWLFGKYFLLLLLVIVYSSSSYGYYNTNTVRTMLNRSIYINYKLEKVLTLNDLYYWVNDTLTSALNQGYGYDGVPIDEPGWVNFHLAKLLGVVRLQQVRHAKKVIGLTTLYFDEKDYLPNWQELNQTHHYMDKYWRIYHPWLSKQYEGLTSWLMAFIHIYPLYEYSSHNGYVTLLARDRDNSEKILKFLKTQNWLDNRTIAVFIDFTLYNTDSNIFSICSVLVEQTPFGDLSWGLSVQSVQLLWNMNEISLKWWLLLGLYIFQLIQFCKVLIIRAWFSKGFFKSRWNRVDFTIILLNILLLIITVSREYYVLHVIKTFLLSKKVEYVDFRLACLFGYVKDVLTGILICLASIRIWKLLQFSSIFRIFNRTLYTSSVPLLSTILGIHIFLFAVSLSAEILNGSQTEIFSRYLKSMTSIMSFSFGFNSRTDPADLNHGGGVLGFLLYLSLMFVVAIFLINMFITLICDHFSNAREERDQEPPNKLTYWQFLKMEYSHIKIRFQKCFSQKKVIEKQTVTENIHNHLDKLEQKQQDEQSTTLHNTKNVNTEDEQLKADRERADRVQKVVAILKVQMEILERNLIIQSLESDTEDEEPEEEIGSAENL